MNFDDMASDIGVEREDFIELVEMLVDVSQKDIDTFTIAINNKNYKDASMAAHSIKGAAGNLGFKALSSVAAELEKAAKASDESTMSEKITFLQDELNRIAKTLQ